MLCYCYRKSVNSNRTIISSEQTNSSTNLTSRPASAPVKNSRRCNGTDSNTGKPKLTAPDGTVVKVKEAKAEDIEQLDCGKPVNFTYYDNLLGISNRQSHPHVPELQMELIFKKKVIKDQDVENLERKLKKAKRDVCFRFYIYDVCIILILLSCSLLFT